MATFRRILCRPYVSFALIANQALNIFCLNFFQEKNHRQQKNSLRIFTVIGDLTALMFVRVKRSCLPYF